MQIKKVTNPKNRVFEERRSIRKYKKDVKISKDELTSIINDAISAPSSLNLQPWRFAVIESKKALEDVKPFLLFNQTQAETCSAIIVVYIDTNAESRAVEILDGEVKLGLKTKEQKEKFLEFVKSIRGSRSAETVLNSQFLDCGFASMQLMLSITNYGYASNPIGAFDKEAISKYLDIDTKRYIPAVLFTIGKADEDGKATSRFEANDVIFWR
ncbi:MAG: nitroreductase family protein [Campylobacteraceae bacterium]